MQAKKYLFLLSAFLLSLTGGLHAQYNPYWQWARADTINAKANENAASVLAVKNGKALWGRMTNVKRVANGVAQGDYLISEYDSLGKQISATAIIGKVQLIDAQADAAGNWYVLLKLYDTALFASGAMVTRPNPDFNTDADHYMVRYNAISLTLSWLKAIGPLVNVSARAFTLDASKIYVAADSANNTVVRTLNFTTGNETSMFTQRGTSTSTSIQVDAQGGVYLAGSCALDGINFNGATEPATLPDGYSYIVKYRSNGTHAWHYWMRDPFCFQRKLTLYNNRFLYYTGSTIDSFSFAGTPIFPTPLTGFIAARLDTNGTAVWVRQNSSISGQVVFNEPFHAVVTPDTALVLFPRITGYVDWGDSVDSRLVGYSASSLVSIGPNNKARWARPILAQYTSNQHVATEGTAIWVTGDAYTETGFVVFDTLNLKMPSRKFVSYLAKTKLIRPIPVTSGVSGFGGDEIAVYPVPASTTLRIEGLHGKSLLILTDISGRVVREVSTLAATAAMDVEDLPRGLYMLELRSDDARIVRKVVLQ